MSDPTDRDEMLESVALYALGVLPREEAALVASFIANDSEARREYLDLRAAADMLAHTAEEPVDSLRSSRMRERLMARVRSDAAAGTVVPRRFPAVWPAWLWGTGLVAAMAVGFALVTVVQDVGLRSDLATAQRHSTALQTQIAQDEHAATQERRALADLLAPDAKRYEVADGAVVVRRDHVYFAFSNLPALPKGRVYQAWIMPKGSKTPSPSVLFTPNADGVAVVPLPVDAARVGAVAVSVEPEGGSKAPTTTPTFVRQLS